MGVGIMGIGIGMGMGIGIGMGIGTMGWDNGHWDGMGWDGIGMGLGFNELWAASIYRGDFNNKKESHAAKKIG